MQMPPQNWQSCMQYLRVPWHLALRWWHALSQSKWSEAVELRQAFLLHEHAPAGSIRETIASPARLVKIVENLATERRLSQREARRLTEYILACTDHGGRWKARAETTNDDGPEAA